MESVGLPRWSDTWALFGEVGADTPGMGLEVFLLHLAALVTVKGINVLLRRQKIVGADMALLRNTG